MESFRLSRLSRLPTHLTQNAAERQRQGTLAQATKNRSKLATFVDDDADRPDDAAPFETVDLVGPTAGIAPYGDNGLRWRARFDRWMVNEGRSRQSSPTHEQPVLTPFRRSRRLPHPHVRRLGPLEPTRPRLWPRPLQPEGQPRRRPGDLWSVVRSVRAIARWSRRLAVPDPD